VPQLPWALDQERVPLQALQVPLEQREHQGQRALPGPLAQQVQPAWWSFSSYLRRHRTLREPRRQSLLPGKCLSTSS